MLGEGGGCLWGMAREGGCALFLLFHNVGSAWGPGREMLEAELRRWGVQWDVVGLAEMWLDEDSEKGMAVKGYRAMCASRKKMGRGGEVLNLRAGLMYREKCYLGTFTEEVFESLSIELQRGGECRNDIIVFFIEHLRL